MRVALAVVVALGACRSPSSGARAQPPSPPAAAAVELAAFVPADTPIAIFIERSLLDHPFGDMMTDGSLDEARADLASAAARPRATPADRFWGAVADELKALDEAAVRNAGWYPGRSEMVAYGLGLVTVVRARADGAKFRALLDRALKASGVKLTEAAWKGRPYLSFEPEPGGPKILLAHSDDQVVLMIAAQPEAVLDHLTTFTPPPGPSLASSWAVGAGDDRFFYLDPEQLGGLLADRDQVVRLVGASEELPDAPCLAAAGKTIATLPRTTSTVAVDDRRMRMQFAFDVAAETAAALRGAPLPGWPDFPAGVPALRLGIGAAPYPLMMRTAGMYERLGEAAVACGDPMDGPSPLAALAQLAPLQIVQGASWEMAAFDGREITMTLSLTVRDVPALWTLLSGVMPLLGPTVPAIGEIRDVPGGVPMKIGVGRERVVGAMGGAATRRIKDYIAAEPGPRAPMLGSINHGLMRGFRAGTFTFLGQPMVDDDPDRDIKADVTLDSRVDGTRVILDLTLTTPSAVNN